MSDINPKWFKRDFWTHQEATCLFHGMNPDPDTLEFTFNPIHHATVSKSFDPMSKHEALNSNILEALQIFECADWSLIGGSSTDKEKRKYDDYFQLAKLKSIHVSKQLLDAKEKFEKEEKRRREEMGKKAATTSQSEKLLSGKMLDILEPIINTIEYFENCPEYKKYGAKIQQQQIDNWLDDHPTHQRRHLKELITEYYEIETARK